MALFSELQVQGIRELFRFICGQLFLGCQAALVLDEKLVETVGDMLVDLAHHVDERFLVSDTAERDEVLCFRLSTFLGILS